MIDFKREKVWVTGANSMVGHQLCNLLRILNADVIPIVREEYNLLDYYNLVRAADIYGFPKYLFHLAGYNGGIKLNKECPASIFGQTFRIAMNVFDFCSCHKVSKVVTPLTSCGYPDSNNPLTEDQYLSEKPHDSVMAHGYCRRNMLIYGITLNRQFGNRFVFPILNNSFGPLDRFNEPGRLKVAGALIAKFVDAKLDNKSEVTLFGDGTPRRELIYSEDFARGLIEVMDKYEDYESPINLGWGEDISIKELAEKIISIVEYKGQVIWDTSFPNGAMRKLLNVDKMRKVLNWKPTTSIDKALHDTITYYRYLVRSSM